MALISETHLPQPVDTRSPSRALLISHNPATGEELGRVPICTLEEVNAAVARARAAQPAWASLPLGARLGYLRGLREELAARASELSDLVAMEMGKHPTEALLGDIMLGLTHLDYVIRRAPHLLRARRVRHSLLFATRHARVVLEPRGVIGTISPYNYPILMTANNLFLALAAGNVVVTKPSEHTPLSVLKLAEICRDAGLPASVFEVVTGDSSTGAALVDSPIDSLVFVGGTATGRKIAVAAGARLLPVTFELGGSNAMLVLADADLRMAARAAVWGGFLTAGQVCSRVARIFVDGRVIDRFTDAIRLETERVRHAPSAVHGVDIGPLVASAGLSHVRLSAEEALAEGASIVAGVLPGAHDGTGPALFPPVVLTGVTQSMRVMREEIFGPLICLQPVSDVSEGIALANNSPYTLTASVWSRSRKEALRAARRIRAGSVTINEVMAPAFAPESPWGGMGGASGHGRIGGPWGLAELTHTKYISYDHLPVRRYPWWFPYTPISHKLGLLWIDLLYGRSMRDRAAAFAGILHDLPAILRLLR